MHSVFPSKLGVTIGHIIEVYVDDIVVKSKKTGDLVPDLIEVLAK
jgi:hypothetical protein